MAVTEDRVIAIETDVEGHHKTLYGKEGRGGLVKDVGDNTTFRRGSTRVLWIIVAVLITSLFSGVVYAIKLMSTMHQMMAAIGG